MEEIFLDIDASGFKEQDAKIKKEGYIERKYTSSAAREIEAAFKRHLLKQLISSRGLTTPSQINALKPELNEAVKTTLYKVGPDGAKMFKFQMYIPSEKLKRQREQALMNEEFNINEEFAPNNYSNISKKSKKINNITVKRSNKSINELSTMLSKFSISNSALKSKKQSKSGHLLINNDFIENILSITNTNNSNSNSNNNSNNNNDRDRVFVKALVTGRSKGEIKFIKEIVELFINKGMDKKMAIKLGVILGNLPENEFDNIEKTVKKSFSEKVSIDMVAQQLYQYLLSKKSGGKKRTHKRRAYKKRNTCRRTYHK